MILLLFCCMIFSLYIAGYLKAVWASAFSAVKFGLYFQVTSLGSSRGSPVAWPKSAKPAAKRFCNAPVSQNIYRRQHILPAVFAR